MFKLELGKFMYKFQNELLPTPFRSFFTFSKDIHAHSTRNISKKLYITRKHKNTGLNSISHTGTSLWNNLPNSLKEKINLRSFTSEYKKFMISSYKL